jgi:hypothetical protein
LNEFLFLETLDRIAHTLEQIAIELRHKHQHHLEVRFMAVTLTVGTPLERTITAGYPDPNNAGDFLVDPNATLVVSEDSNGSILELGPPSGTNPVTLVYTPVAVGTANVTAVATDPDGTTVSGSEVVTVVAAAPPPPDTDATEITFS